SAGEPEPGMAGGGK
ncbi:rhs element Vgr family protein, partial [Escherichia coli 96.0428]